jgi:hypothetical protein
MILKQVSAKNYRFIVGYPSYLIGTFYNFYLDKMLPGEMSTHDTFCSWPASVFKGIQPGWVQTWVKWDNS